MFLIEYSLHPRDPKFDLQKIFSIWKSTGKRFDDLDTSIAICKGLSDINSGSFRVKNILNGSVLFETEMKEKI